jgi:hypothetical protein|uniref:DNA-packaging protein small subunit n=1 Tax=Myoviridae sp. ctp4Q36 TaxID=2827708 RepID=A0A8S5T183_9CAUD|nr:MAG TPA: DNA-packaging protein small subunit [Myoviridae sp. ctp4Q36]
MLYHTKDKTSDLQKAVLASITPHPMARKDWARNQEQIRLAVFKTWASSQRIPTNEEIAKLTGLHVKTVRKHWRDYDPEEMKVILRESASTLLRPMLFGMYNGAMKGKADCARVIMELAGVAEKQDTTINITNNNAQVTKLDEQEVVSIEEKIKKIGRRMARDVELGVENSDADTQQ